MPKPLRIEVAWRCHWSLISGPARAGRTIQTPVWVCEYPFRTLRPLGPGLDCLDCPNRRYASEGPPCDYSSDPFARLPRKLVS